MERIIIFDTTLRDGEQVPGCKLNTKEKLELALELAPIRVNAISPGVIDTGAWEALGEQGKADYFADMSARNPARRIGTPEDIAQGVLFALTSTFLTGQTLHIDGGEPLT